MPTHLWIISSERTRAADERIARFAEFVGIEYQLIPLDSNGHSNLDLPSFGNFSIAEANLTEAVGNERFKTSIANARHILCYCDREYAAHSPGLMAAANKTVRIERIALAKKCRIEGLARFGKFSVSNQSFDLEPAEARLGFKEAHGAIPLISLDEQPVFLSFTCAETSWFLLATRDLPDLEQRLSPSEPLVHRYPDLTALALFFRIAFGDQCWTAPIKAANFIIDDPSLHSRYGFVEYAPLLKQLESIRAALTVAFIPYNYASSDPDTIALLQNHRDKFSIAVHGCDHTAGEYASSDAQWLLGTTQCALTRMARHTQLTGYPFENVMVFPQGRFSTAAIQALKEARFEAAVNSGAWPRDYENNPLRLKDTLEVAVTRFAQFPIFTRRYPRLTFEFAFDLLFQKPLLAVEHHAYFRHGFDQFSQFISRVNNMNCQLSWMPLGDALASSCVLSRVTDREFKLKHFSPRAVFTNQFDKPISLRIQKLDGCDDVESVVVNGQTVDFTCQAGHVHYLVSVKPGHRVEAIVGYHRRVLPQRRTSVKFKLATAIRRKLSDLRDNHLSRSERILGLAEKTKNTLARRTH
jgi:hypothetical protein